MTGVIGDAPGTMADVLSSMRLIMYHKSPTSARTQFLLQGNGVCLPGQLPKLAQVIEPTGKRDTGKKVHAHPSTLLLHASQWLSIPKDTLELDSAFHERVDIAGGPLTVYLARFTTIDPPYDAAERVGGRFIALTEGRLLAPAELDLLRRAYSVIMED